MFLAAKKAKTEASCDVRKLLAWGAHFIDAHCGTAVPRRRAQIYTQILESAGVELLPEYLD
jgi:hypothetical protein